MAKIIEVARMEPKDKQFTLVTAWGVLLTSSACLR